MAKSNNETYIDYKGRTRWHCNDAVAEKLKELHAYLVIGGYPKDHAARYPRLAHAISRHPESIEQIQKEGRLSEIPGVGGKVTQIVTDLIKKGSSSKMGETDENFTPPPKSVLQLVRIPRLGVKTAKMLYHEHGISSLAKLKAALKSGELRGIKGIGKKMVETIEKHIAEQRRSAPRG